MEQIAFITYNTAGYRIPSGWNEQEGRRAFVMQGNRAVCSLAESTNEDRRWLMKHIKEFQHMVIYLGVHMSCNEGILSILWEAKFPVSQITFVFCECSLDEKKKILKRFNLTDARQVISECGGRQAMRTLYETFFRRGIAFLEKGEFEISFTH